MYKLLPILLLLASSLAQDNDGDLESIIKQLQQQANNNGQTVNKITTPPPQASTLVPSVVDRTDNGDKSCITADNQAGECVPYYLCGANDTIINDGAGIIDIRVKDGECTSYLDTCCLPPDRKSPDNPITPAPPAKVTFQHSTTTVTRDSFSLERDRQFPTSQMRSRSSSQRYSQNTLRRDRQFPPSQMRSRSSSQRDKPKHAKEREGCGWRNPDGLGFRITGAANGEANFGEFPWMVAILKIEPVNENEPNGQKLNVYVGGGSLIHPSVVLTAAHYVSSGNQLRVRAGEWDTQTKNELYPYQDRDVKEVITHKDFNKGNLFYDIGLLFLASPIDPAPNVGVACLPSPGVRAVSGARCLASGWGKDLFGKEGRYQVILKRVEVPVVERGRCQEELRKTRLGKHFVLHSSFMCAGGEPGNDTCKGDGGSPLVCPSEFEKDRYIQHGIVAWGIGCGDATPAVYVDVGHLRSWIDDKVRGHGYDEKTYTYID